MPEKEHISLMKLPVNPKLIFMGTPEFSLPGLDHLIRYNYQILAVITQPDRPKGRGRKVTHSPVKKTALDHGIEVLQPERVSERRFCERIRGLKPDLIIVTAFGQILKKEFLDIPGYGAVNIHASLLPKFRGAAPIQHAILNREPETGLTIIHMDEGMDTGPILWVEKLPILPDETAGHLHDRLAEKTGPLIIRFLREAAGRGVETKAQDSSRAVYAPKIEKEQTVIPWQETAADISAMIRAYDPFPGARTTLEGKEIKLFKPRTMEPRTGEQDIPDSVPGRVVKSGEEGFFIETGRGIIEIMEVQFSGRKRMPVIEFLRGFPLQPGTRLGKIHA